MLAKRTANNQITLPEAIVRAVGDADYFEVAADNGRIVLTPVRLEGADAVRTKLTELGITEAALPAAIEWSRQKP